MIARLVDALRRFLFPERATVHALPFAAIAMIGAAVGVGLATLSIAHRTEWALYDRMMRLSVSSPQPPSDIVVVAIDELSFNEIGLQWPWPRRMHAAVVDALVRGGARTIVFDVIFDTPSTADDDEALARAIRRAGNVVLGSDLATVADRAYEVQQWAEPLPAFAAGAAKVAAVGIDIDPDGVLRRAPALIADREALALAAAERTPGFIVPAEIATPRLIRFSGVPRKGIITVSYYQVLERGLLPADIFGGKTVFVGRSLATAAALDAPDHFRTPVAVRMPGVEIHASHLDSLLRKRFVRDPFGGRAAWLAWCAVVAIAAGLLFFRCAPQVSAAVLVFGSLGLAVVAYVGLAAFNVRLPIIAGTIVAALVNVSTTAYRVALGHRERRLIKRAFQHYVAPAIVQQMLDDPSQLKVGGEQRLVTIMFTDLEGFTTVSERLAPEQLRLTLSTYFKAMMDLLLAERATLDKFIGDAIMVYFGCPIPDDAHAAHACRAALAMQQRLAVLNATWQQSGLPPLRMRIGVNTGTVIAGNMGTDEIFNFTILGDPVNLASRLEGVNKEYRTHTIVGAETWSRVEGLFDARELDWIRVKGKAQPIAIHELLGEAGTLREPQRTVLTRFGEGLAWYRARRWDEASDAFRRALAIDPSDGPSAVFLARCTEYAITPPPPDWDGVYVMHTK